MTEDEVVAVIQHVANVLAAQYKAYGYFTRDDLKQEVMAFALNGLASGKYDPSRPLDKFLFAHCKNRLMNLRRDRYFRTDGPCKACQRTFGKGHDGHPCASHERWLARNSTKAKLVGALSMDEAVTDSRCSREVDPAEAAEQKDLLAYVAARIPPEWRESFDKLMDGDDDIPRRHRRGLRHAIARIMRGVSDDDRLDCAAA
jgi:hypothetical protein